MEAMDRRCCTDDDDNAKEGNDQRAQNYIPCQLPSPGSFITWLLVLVSTCL